MKSIFLNIVLTLTSLGAVASPAIETSTTKHMTGATSGLNTDILIGTVDSTPLYINLALPKDNGEEPRPALVLIHGGGLIKGDRSRYNKRISKMAKRGIIGASVMYRLAPEYRFPAAIEDVKAAIRFLKANADTFNLDPERIIVSGASAGGYLAAMVGVTGNAKGFSDHDIYPNFDASVRAVIVQSAPLANYTRAKYEHFAIAERFIDQGNKSRREALAAISPVTYLDKNDPPFFLAHGSADEKVPVDMTRDFVDHLETMKLEHEYIEVEGGKHSLNASRPEKASEVFRASMVFFNKHCR